MLQTFQLDRTNKIDTPSNNFSVNNKSTIIAYPEYDQAESELINTSTMLSCIRLGLTELKSFELVDNQFKYWGVTFSNAVAIEPSNPAFAVPPGVKVLMGAPKSGLIEINFKYPVKFVSGVVTSSRRTILSAYNQNEELLAEDEMPSSNLLNSDGVIPPSAKLTVNGENIHKVSFYAFDGQLILIDLTFGF
ncbi:MAG: hypothetical protein QNJ68_12255 [Microcoleaceae cyanobacterium MO_207.B10]|nr:hypothetical protein [Microcoleaceae cyanobacterium MO_207.B10]